MNNVFNNTSSDVKNNIEQLASDLQAYKYRNARDYNDVSDLISEGNNFVSYRTIQLIKKIYNIDVLSLLNDSMEYYEALEHLYSYCFSLNVEPSKYYYTDLINELANNYAVDDVIEHYNHNCYCDSYKI